MTSLSGCVLPVGPRFEDPPTTENIPPFITSSMPTAGMIVTAVNKSYTFSINFNDLNGDPLYVRWVADYPQTTSSGHILADMPFGSPANGQPYFPSSEDVSCLKALALNTAQHNITVFVSDQPFWSLTEKGAPTDPLILLTQNKTNSVMAQANWVLNVQCP